MRRITPSAIFKWSLLAGGSLVIFGLILIALAPWFWRPDAQMEVLSIISDPFKLEETDPEN